MNINKSLTIRDGSLFGFSLKNEHISYDKKLAKKIRRKKIIAAIVANFVISTEISHYSTNAMTIFFLQFSLLVFSH